MNQILIAVILFSGTCLAQYQNNYKLPKLSQFPDSQFGKYPQNTHPSESPIGQGYSSPEEIQKAVSTLTNLLHNNGKKPAEHATEQMQKASIETLVKTMVELDRQSKQKDLLAQLVDFMQEKKMKHLLSKLHEQLTTDSGKSKKQKEMAALLRAMEKVLKKKAQKSEEPQYYYSMGAPVITSVPDPLKYEMKSFPTSVSPYEMYPPISEFSGGKTYKSPYDPKMEHYVIKDGATIFPPKYGNEKPLIGPGFGEDFYTAEASNVYHDQKEHHSSLDNDYDDWKKAPPMKKNGPKKPSPPAYVIKIKKKYN